MLFYKPISTTQGRITETTIAHNVVARRPRLGKTPAAVDLAAECLLRFHRTINGSLCPSLKSRPDSYARRQSVGIKPLEVSDIAELMTVEGPHKTTARAAVRELLAPALDRFEDETPSGLLLNEAVADFSEASARVGQAFMRCQDRTQLLDELGHAEAAARTLRRLLHLHPTTTTTAR